MNSYKTVFHLQISPNKLQREVSPSVIITMMYAARITKVIYFIIIMLPSSTWGTATVLRLSNQGLVSVPSGIDPNTTELHLYYNDITRIEQHSFQGLFLLRRIFISYNKIYFFDDSCFTSCLALEVLNFQRNRVIILPEVGVLTSLVYFIAHDNYVYIPADYFYDLEKITTIGLKDCGLNNVPYFSASSHVGGLFMRGNPIITVSDLSQMDSLAVLEMDTDLLLCDMRLCWVLFEPFDPTAHPPFISPVSGASYQPANALDPETLRCNNLPYSGTLLSDINPVQLKCYNSKLYYKKLSMAELHQESYN